MLPRRAQVQTRIPRGRWCSTSAAALLLLCMVMPFLWWQFNSTALLPGRSPTGTTPLQRLARQRAFGSGVHTRLQDSTWEGSQQQEQELEHDLSTDSRSLVLTAARVAAAQAYLRDVVQQPKRRAAVQPKQYVISPEPYDMRQQHSKVKAYLQSPAFAAKQAARKARGQRGIIINVGGPQLISSTIVTLKVLREVLHCTLPIELAWHTPSEMDPGTLTALQHHWGPIAALNLSALPWPGHHRRWAEVMEPPAAHNVPAAAGGSDTRPGRSSSGDSSGGSSSGGSSGGSSSGGSAGQAGPEGHGVQAAAGGSDTGRAAVKHRGFLFKVWSLAASSFASALLLDADNLPVADPAGLWADASFQLYGNMFWPDFWPPGSSEDAVEVVTDMVGLEQHTAAELLAAGKGSHMSWRGTESGQVLIDLVRHGDVAEWALWINSFGDSVYRALWGDKDTYSLAFAVAGKAHEFNQLKSAPAGAFSWRADSLLVKASQQVVDGWQLAGMVQFDAWGQPAFLHRTMNKFSWDGQPWDIGLLSAPLPQRWIDYYLSLNALGPTVGVPVTYAAPASAFAAVTLDLFNTSNATSDSAGSMPGCPLTTFNTYWRLRQQGVPVGSIPTLDTACQEALEALTGPLATQLNTQQLRLHPELLALALAARAQPPHPQQPQAQPHQAQPLQLQHGPGSTPGNEDGLTALLVAALLLPGAGASGVRVGLLGVLQASYEACEWMQQHKEDFPVLAQAGRRGTQQQAAMMAVQQHGTADALTSQTAAAAAQQQRRRQHPQQQQQQWQRSRRRRQQQQRARATSTQPQQARGASLRLAQHRARDMLAHPQHSRGV